MISTNIWNRLKSQADSAFSIVNKSLQESTTNVFSSLAKTNFSDNNEINTSNATDNKISSNGIWNSLLTNVKSVNQINSIDESTTKKHKSRNLEDYFQVFYKNQIEDKEFTKWDLNDSLPKLPVPDLNSSMNMYLDCVKSLELPDEAFTNVERLVKDFIKKDGVGQALQNILLKRAQDRDNWSYDWWIDEKFLRNKKPLPINSNPAMVFPIETFVDESDQLKFASRLITTVFDFKTLIDEQPGPNKDDSKDTSANLALKPEHVIIICKNQIYVLDLVVNFTRLNEEQIFEQLKRIKRQSEREEKTLMYFANVGYLTSLPRNEWCQVREDLVEESKVNLESLSQIERCICVVCLDKKIDVESICTGDLNSPFDDENEIEKSNFGKQTAKTLNEEINLTRVAFQMLHGCKTNSGNRWFDKTIQFIVSEDGCCGMCYENSPADATVISELCQHIIRFM